MTFVPLGPFVSNGNLGQFADGLVDRDLAEHRFGQEKYVSHTDRSFLGWSREFDDVSSNYSVREQNFATLRRNRDASVVRPAAYSEAHEFAAERFLPASDIPVHRFRSAPAEAASQFSDVGDLVVPWLFRLGKGNANLDEELPEEDDIQQQQENKHDDERDHENDREVETTDPA